MDCEIEPQSQEVGSTQVNALIYIRTTFPIGEHSGGALESRQKGRGFEPHRRHCIVSFSKHINPCLVLVQPRKTRPDITEKVLTGT